MDKKVFKNKSIRNRDDNSKRSTRPKKKDGVIGGRKYHIKKSDGHIHQGLKERIKIIKELSSEHDVKLLCKVLKVSRSTYYDAINRGISNREKENEQLKIKILEIYNKSKKRYGAPKIQKMLEKEGYEISLKRVQRLMKKLGIKSIIIKKFRPSTSKNKVPEGKPNLLDQDFSTERLNEKWVGDITYIYTIKDGWTYLASILDLHSKKIIGYSYSKNMTTEIVVEALKNAMKGRKIEEGIILHTDLGSQYTSKEFEEYLERSKIQHSYSKKGCPYDNA